MEGNVYNTVTIGTQDWMAENLKTTKYSDKTDIPFVPGEMEYIALTTPGYYWKFNDIAGIYGGLYNWYSIETASNGGRNLCPTSWHVPTDAEWTTLRDYLGGESVAGGKLKETGLTHWWSPNEGATNETGFTALPGGLRFDDGTYFVIGGNGYWWSSTELSTTTYAWYGRMTYDITYVYRDSISKLYGFSVRCVRDL
ncbi:MAG: fibrobacter succinogenes major paralogous domain-containing protein [Bacteroidota bacterium]